jgi:hypothetical protein
MTTRAIAILVASAAMACFAAPASAALHLSQIGSFSQPVYVTAPPGDPHRVFVVEQAGRIMEVLDGQKLDAPFLDITRDVKFGGEQGLLSMAFAPDYATSGRFYVYYNAPAASGSTITVAEFKHAAGSLDAADAASRRTVFTVDHPSNTNHNGGQLQFGPDGLLYAGTGDGGSGNDPPNNAQNPGSLLGKLLRIDPVSGATTPEIYALGLRNPFRFSFDRQAGDLVIGDVGQSAREEVDLSPKGTPAGMNYGWRCWEGTLKNTSISPQCDPGNDVKPVLEKDHSNDHYCAIIGGYVVRDPALGALAGRYVYGDNCQSAIRSAALAIPRTTDDTDTGLTVSGLTSFGEDSCGHVYAASGSGPVYRIDGDSFTPCSEPAPPTGPPTSTSTPTAPPPPDTTAPALQVGARRAQRILRLGGLRLSIACDEMCGATATATIHIGGSARVYRLALLTRQIGAGARVKVTLHASKRTLRAVRAAFRHRRRVRAVLSVSALDAAGNRAAASRAVRAVR